MTKGDEREYSNQVVVFFLLSNLFKEAFPVRTICYVLIFIGVRGAVFELSLKNQVCKAGLSVRTDQPIVPSSLVAFLIGDVPRVRQVGIFSDRQ